MSPGHERGRPRQESGPVNSTDSIVPDPTDIGRRARRQDFGLLVVTERSDGVLTSQVFVSLPAAERKVHRARQRHLFASISLVRIVPVVGATDADLALVIGEAG